MQELYQYQSLPLNVKIAMTKERIKGWIDRYGEDGVYISFSGGKDSTVLLDIVRNRCGYKNIPAVFVDVPTQYPELKTFAEKFENVEIIRPKISFMQVCEKYGFPLISKEVSECVEGARKYLTSILESASCVDRQTDRHYSYEYYYNKLCGFGVYNKSDTGGQDSKYRKLRGIGEYHKSGQEKRSKSKNSNSSRNADNRQQDKGEYP